MASNEGPPPSISAPEDVEMVDSCAANASKQASAPKQANAPQPTPTKQPAAKRGRTAYEQQSLQNYQELRMGSQLLMDAETAWYAGEVPDEIRAAPKLKEMATREIYIDRATGTLESLSENPLVNWYSVSPSFRGDPRIANKFVSKVRCDPESVQAFANLLLAKGAAANAAFINVEWEQVTQRASLARRRDFISKLPNQHPAQRQLAQRQLAQPQLAAPQVHAQAAPPPQPEVKACPNCKRPGHNLKDCISPSYAHGSIGGCPVCNTLDHSLDDCQLVNDESKIRGDPEHLRALCKMLVLDRANKPQFRSKKWMAFDVLNRAQPDNSDLDRTCLWPWTNEFSVQIAAMHRGDPKLQGKKHPRDFIYGVDTEESLPRDPFFQNVDTTKQILHLLSRGAFDKERFISTEEKMKLAELQRTAAANKQTFVESADVQAFTVNLSAPKATGFVTSKWSHAKRDRAALSTQGLIAARAAAMRAQEKRNGSQNPGPQPGPSQPQ
ncbi:hypothetical protein QBC42DRAFT_332137 [Cladorrhinum samala]|uniref:CCHC-type domain-containing protein n=1 Tax=Cladorrhinum samala TaxID=585594 RepID=A0AAV9HJD1_9PEZI|nr:hypothetical protein QBC42DRAFT_332137 [Cladorrhinum samala]